MASVLVATEGVIRSASLSTVSGSQMPGAGYTTTAEDHHEVADFVRDGSARDGC
jgi:hypothetical protein